MASSIRCALHYLEGKKENIHGALFMVCDQPYVSSHLLTQLWEELLKGANTMVACKYDGRLGTPAAFRASHFPELMKLKGDRGAGKYLNDHKEQVQAISFAEGIRDIDTEEEYKVLTDGTANDH
jgi:molybdenum cofactor cytidylyltransferase